MDEGLREKRRDEVRCGMSVFLYRIDMDGGLLSVERATSYSRVNVADGRIVSKDTSSFFPSGRENGGSRNLLMRATCAGQID